MTNYTEQLKKYWKSKDLTFIATFKKINDKGGFFNHFINPTSKMRLYYPAFDEIEIEDKRVSFFYTQVKNLNDGHLYKVRLQYTENPKKRNNPYSLEIESVSELDQEKVIAYLHEENNIAEAQTIYIGKYVKIRENLSVFVDVMSEESGEILMGDGVRQQVYVSPKINLVENKFYSFSIIKNNGKRPNVIPKSISPIINNPYQDYIRLRFERLNNPEANKMIANLMREIGKGMYSSKQRMIFELLQNADDAPAKDKVEFHIDVNGDYFFVMHDGAPFNKDDVEAITSAAESTKRGDNKKTGYKGIGFKSVFTDSSEVWLKSGGYQFAFQRNNQLFNDFDKFYFSSKRYQQYPDLLEEDKLKYRNQRLKFNGSTDIPWQVIPIWQENLPSEFNDSNFNNFNNPVQFALKLGESNIEEYKLAIDNITKRPQFLLFLRNTSKFRSPKNGVTVTRNDIGDIIEIEKSKVIYVDYESKQQHNIFQYTKQSFENIPVSDESFSELNIGLLKQSKINDYNEVTYFFTDLEGREIETIPPKLASVNETEISFGISLSNNKITSEKEYIQGLRKYSSLFTYLPMEDTRFQLPFLVNADFVPSSDRQKIQGDNLWNKYIMIKVAEMHIKTLNYYAEEFKNDNVTYQSYLSLLLKNLLPSDDTAQQIIDSYNEKYEEELSIKPIIINEDEQTQLLSETIIDDSGIVDLLGNDIFYEIINTEKRLPHFNLDVKYLKAYEYLNVEVVNLEQLAQNITPEICERLGEVIKANSCFDTSELLNWLNKLVEYIPDYFNKIPFIVHNNALFSIERLLKESEAWLINKNTKEYENLFKGLGYNTINLQLDKYPNINHFLFSISAYINDKSLAYERLVSNPNIHRIDSSLKLELINFLQNSDFMIGVGEKRYFEELNLFVDATGTPRPLRKLLTPITDTSIVSLNNFSINKNEFDVLPESLKKELIAHDSIFTSFILDKDLFCEWSVQFNAQNITQYVDDLKKTYSWRKESAEILKSQWASIPWMYVNDDTRFIDSDKIFWSDVFYELSDDKFSTVSKILTQSNLKTLPIKVCGELINLFNLATDNTTITNWAAVKDIDTISANILLDWMEEDNSYSDFFTSYSFTSEGNKWSVTSSESKLVYDGSITKYKDYIGNIENLKSRFLELNSSLCSDSRNKIGLLQDGYLLKAIIETKCFNQDLALFLPNELQFRQYKFFIEHLPVFNLKTDREYNSESAEHIILNNILKHVDDVENISSDVQELINLLREKIFIDEQPLSNYDLNDIIQFSKKGEQGYTLKLSDVLNEFKGESDVLEKVNESFLNIKQKSILRRLIFNSRRMSKKDICSKIEAEDSSFYSEHQVVFQLLYKKNGGSFQWKKQHFDDYWKSVNQMNMVHNAYKVFLNLVFEIDLCDLSNFSFLDLELENCVDKDYAIQSEIIPGWLEEWICIDQTKRIEFLTKLGYNGTNSSLVKLRQAFISTPNDENIVTKHFVDAKQNMQLISNSVIWLSKFNSEIITNNISIIQQINFLHVYNAQNQNAKYIPVIKNISLDDKRYYEIVKVDTSSSLFFINENTEFSREIFDVLTKKIPNSLFVDSTCGNMQLYFEKEQVTSTAIVNHDKLHSNSTLWDEPFYNKWEFKDKFQIYIYNGNEIPYLRIYKDIIIKEFELDLKVYSGNNYYISKALKDDILSNLPFQFPNEYYTKLKDWHYRTLLDESLLDEDSYKYNETFDRMIQDRYGLSPNQQNEESVNAKTHALYFLEELGFNLENGSTTGAALYNITNEYGIQVSCIVRSAKGGLLYIDKDHWEMLEDSNTYLVVIYPGNQPRLFRNRLELLSEELAENVLFRVPNQKATNEIDGVFEALESESHLILVTSEKMKESLFSKLKQKNNFNKEESVAVGGDDFKLD